MKMLDLEGKRFGKLTVLRLYPKSNRHGRFWVCKCDCGMEVAVLASNLVSGHTKSCGCTRKNRKGTQMYEPRLNVKKEGFAYFINRYAPVKSVTYDNDFLYLGIIPDIMKTHDKIVRDCFKRKGFSEEFIQEHIKDFRMEVSRSEFLWSCGYFYKDDLLFIIVTDYKFNDNCDIPNKEECTIGFRVEM